MGRWQSYWLKYPRQILSIHMHCEKQTNQFPEAAQGPVRIFKGSILVLEEVIWNTAQMQAPDQSILLMCFKQRDTWFSVHCSMACWWSKDLPCKNQGGWSNHIPPRRVIWKRSIIDQNKRQMHDYLGMPLDFRISGTFKSRGVRVIFTCKDHMWKHIPLSFVYGQLVKIW